MSKKQQPGIAITTDFDALVTRLGYDIDVAADVSEAWEAVRTAKSTHPVFHYWEMPGANSDNQATNLLVVSVAGKHVERFVERLVHELERRWRQPVLMEGVIEPAPNARRISLTEAANHAAQRAAEEQRKKSPARPYGGYAFSVEGPPKDFEITRARVVGSAPHRKIVLAVVEDGTRAELSADEEPHTPGTFACSWTQDDGESGTAKLDLLENAAGDLVLVGTWTTKGAAKGTDCGYWAFHLIPDEDEE
ncbi:MAG: hypothetical protein IT383_01085 [Deltaproteobacteria bacterium]|nr:hypothetical protein [Deltaproteobacteria bacterium]